MIYEVSLPYGEQSVLVNTYTDETAYRLANARNHDAFDYWATWFYVGPKELVSREAFQACNFNEFVVSVGHACHYYEVLESEKVPAEISQLRRYGKLHRSIYSTLADKLEQVYNAENGGEKSEEEFDDTEGEA